MKIGSIVIIGISVMLSIGVLEAATIDKVTIPDVESIHFNKVVFQNAPIKNVMTFLADTAGVNIIVDPGMSITISLKLEDITWKDFFELLIDLYNLRAIQKAGYVYILSNDKYWTRKFDELSNIDRERGQLPTETKLIRVKNVTASGINSSIQSSLSPRGNTVVDATSNTLIITDLPEQFPIIIAMIDSLDIMARQVKISCQILQVDKKHLHEFGVSWFASKTDKTTGSLDAQISTNQVANKIGTFTWGIVKGGEFNFDINLSAYVAQDKTRILDEPHVVTMENQTATINSSIQRVVTRLDDAGNTVQEFKTAATKLTVTPRLASGDSIIMNVNVERSAFMPGAQVEIITRSAQTNVAVESGDLVVIGGLSGEEKMETENGIPLLKDLPLIGRLFKYKKVEVRPYVIVIFIRPEII
jgi:type II secretory pathway component GspD/PulD (secretin)